MIPELINWRLARRDVCMRPMREAAGDSFLVMGWLGSRSLASMMAGHRRSQGVQWLHLHHPPRAERNFRRNLQGKF